MKPERYGVAYCTGPRLDRTTRAVEDQNLDDLLLWIEQQDDLSRLSLTREELRSIMSGSNDDLQRHKIALEKAKVAFLIIHNKVLFKEGADSLEDALRHINKVLGGEQTTKQP